MRFQALALAASILASSSAFDPKSYAKKHALCAAENRLAQTVAHIRIEYVDANPAARTTLLMVHGWPSLWSSWSKQIQAFEDDHRLLIPNLRGFGNSEHPGDVQSSGTLQDLARDLSCVLAHAETSSAICVGHDWGAQVCYEAARTRPDVFLGVIGITVPYVPSSTPYVPTETLLPTLPRLAYQLYFERRTDDAVRELDEDIRRSIRATLRTVNSPPPDAFLTRQDSFLGAWETVEDASGLIRKEIPPVPFFTPDEEAYLIEQYAIRGFRNTLQFYTQNNRYASWKVANAQGNLTLSQPVLSILPTNDPVADWALASKLLRSAAFLPNLRTEFVDGAHWVHLENPDRVNALMRDWLAEMFTGDAHLADEL